MVTLLLLWITPETAMATRVSSPRARCTSESKSSIVRRTP